MEYLSVPDTVLSIAYSPAKISFITPELSATIRDTPSIDDIVTGQLDSYVDPQRETTVAVHNQNDAIRVILLNEILCTFVDVPLSVFKEMWEKVPVC